MSISDFMHLPMTARVFIVAMFVPAIWATALAITAVLSDIGRHFTKLSGSRVNSSAEDPGVRS